MSQVCFCPVLYSWVFLLWGRWSSNLSEAQADPIACVSITEKLVLLYSVPSVMSSRSVCSNSLCTAAPSNTSLKKVGGRQPRGVGKANAGLRGSAEVQDAESGLSYSSDMICELNPTLRNRGRARAVAWDVMQSFSLAKAESGPPETFLADIFKTF